MKTPIVMTVIAEDRPGIVEMISARVAENSGNWEESRMCRLGGQFAGIVKVSVEESKRMYLLDSLHELVEEGLRIIIHEDDNAEPIRKDIPLKIEVVGQDHPGIIRDITNVLFQSNANVEELHTEIQNEPHSGNSLFVANIKLLMPPQGDVDALKLALENVASDLMVDIEFP